MRITRLSVIPASLLMFFVLIVLIYGFKNVSPKEIVKLFDDKEFIYAVVFGLKTSLCAVLFSAILGIPSGFLLARSGSGFSKALDVLFDVPLIVPPLIVGVLLLNLFNSRLLESIYSFVFSFAGAAIAQFFIAFPFTVKSSKTAFELVSPVYERIAMTLGASAFKSFFDTTFKIAFNGILSGMVLSWLRSLGEFGATLIVGGGIAYKTENIPINIYLKIVEGDFKKALAASLLVVVFAFVSVLLIKVLMRKGGNRL